MARLVTPDDADAPAASVIIPSYQAEAVILPCLRSIAAQDFDDPIEVIVVDSSADATRDLVRRDFPQVRLRTRAVQTWPGEARNLGLELARAPLILFIDADAEAQPGWLAAVVERLRQGPWDAVVAAVRTMYPDNLAAHAAQIVEFSGFTVYDRRREVDLGPGVVLAVRREPLDTHGWRFPPLRACEDVMFCRAIRAAGGRLVFEPRAVVAHRDPTDIHHLIRKMEMIGRTGGPLRRSAQLPGGLFVRHPWLIPLMPLARTVVALNRTVRWGWRPWLRSLRASILVYRAMRGYARGFRAGLKE